MTFHRQEVLPHPKPCKSLLTLSCVLFLIVSSIVGNGLLHILLRLSSYYDISKCNPQIAVSNVDLNASATPDAKLCYDFLNSGKCRREKKHGSCSYRHLPLNHIHAIIERIRSGKVIVGVSFDS